MSEASVAVGDALIASISAGFLVLLGIEDADTDEDVRWLAGKILGLRVFADDEGLMNRSIADEGGAFLVVSQFTLHASTKKGNRPSFSRASRPEFAIPMYERFVERLKAASGLTVATGKFGAEMRVSLVNDGPVTIIIDSKTKE